MVEDFPASIHLVVIYRYYYKEYGRLAALKKHILIFFFHTVTFYRLLANLTGHF